MTSLARVALVLAFGLGIAPVARAADIGWADVRVRVYDTSGLPMTVVDRGLAAAAGALAPAALDVRWTHCTAERRAAPKDATCQRPLAGTELSVRLVRAPLPEGHRGVLPLGDALVDTSSGTAVFATVYVDRVEWLARAAGSDLGTLLGHALAHELGHLLMRTTSHPDHGLMRPLWTRSEVQRGREADWRFADGDLARMRQRRQL